MTDQGPVDNRGAARSAALFSPDASVGNEAPAVEVPVPQQIGRYRVLGVIGSGGMGIVYEAEQDTPHRRVAVKVLHAGSANRRSLLRRFRHEAEILARLQHPGIAQVIESGSYDTGEGGRPYLVMEFVRGVALTEYAHRRQLTVTRKLELLARVCDAVHHAHLRGVVHRDLKPANILVVEPDPGTGMADDVGAVQVKVLDFGIARITDSDVQMTTVCTDPGLVVGTLPYMSPEQAVGNADEVDLRSDVYSLGVILYHLLSGQLPLDVERSSMFEALRRIRDDEPVPLGRLARPLRGDVETIVAKAMDKQRDRRYQSASELAQDIRRYMRKEPIVARPPSAAYQLRRFAARHRAAVTAAAAGVLALSVGTTVAVWQAIRATRSEATAVARFNDVRSLANTVIFELEEAIAELPGSTRARKLLVERALEYLDKLGREAANDPSLTAELIAAYTKIGTVQGNPDRPSLGDPAGALASYGRALELLRTMPPGLADDLPTNHRILVLHQQIGETHRGLGNFELAAAQFESARAVAARACRTAPLTAEPRRFYADCSTHLAGVVAAEHGPAEAQRVGEETVGFLDSLPELEPESPSEVSHMGFVHFQLGGLWQHAEQLGRAITQYDRAQPLMRRAATAVPDDIIMALGVADVFWYRGIAREKMRDRDGAITDLDLACRAFDQAIALKPTLRGPHLAWSYARALLARLLADAGDLDRAIDYSRSSVQKLEQVHADYPASVTHVGTAVRGNTEHAELLLSIVRQTENTDHPTSWRLELARESQRHWQRCLELVNSVEDYETKASYSLDPQTVRDRLAELDGLLAALDAD